MSSPSEDSPTFSRFSDLPAELRVNIWRESVDGTIVTFIDHSGTQSLPDPVDNVRRANLEALNTSDESHRVFFEGEGNVVHRMDYDNDTFRTQWMVLPTVTPTPAWPPAGVSAQALPILKLMSVYQSAKPWDDRGQWFAPPFFHTRMALSHLPVLKEFTMVSAQTVADWWVPGYQMHGPDIIVETETRRRRYTPREYQYVTEAASYFNGKNLQGDAGVHWPRGSVEIPREWTGDGHFDYLTRVYRRPYTNEFVNRVFPKVGLRGFSQNEVSAGGQWAGFRYFVGTNRVEFTPLAWYEVQDAVKGNITAEGLFPESIVKIFIVRPGETPYEQPHHAWEAVQPASMWDTSTTATIRELWLFTLLRFNNQIFVSRRMRLDPFPDRND